MNQEIRNKLRNVVTQCRKLLEDSVSQELEGKYGIFAKKDQVTADSSAPMSHLTEEEQAARTDILDHFAHIKARGFKPKDALDQLVREIAFTHLNRLCAYKMMEAREVYINGQKFRESVSRGVDSNGVKFYLADHPEDERLYNTGHQEIAYRHFLDWLGGLLSEEIGVLFSPNDPANRLYPKQKTLDEVLGLLNGGGIKPEETELREEWPNIWSQDETIGWVYQYFTPKELRDQARKDSAAPRNSYELAFRNQFFTPRYVVEFLTDNTLGRIWYEMRKGDTALNDQCRYIVRSRTEVFLKEGEQPPKESSEKSDDLSQEELLKLPVYISNRPKKDPREVRILDPACGSGHFLLYCFDLLLTIYEEAYADSELGPALQKDYLKLEDLRQDVPRLILAHNVHGIDIDLRCSQIAALALWLRCQRAYQEMGLKKERPRITRSNFVCAEPMPGEEQMLKDFVSQLEPKLLGQVVEVVFDKMKLAGEAGSLLKIEEEIREAVAAAKKQWVRETTQATDRKGRTLLFTEAELDRLSGKPEQPWLFDVSDLSDDQFFEQAEAKVIQALRQYAEKAQNGPNLQRRLFTEDAVRGFAFMDLCHRRFDVVIMNPPFGEPSKPSKTYVDAHYSVSKNDVYAAFVERGLELLHPRGQLGAITSRSGFFLSLLQKWREEVVLSKARLTVFADLGFGVLDTAMVETAAYCLCKESDYSFGRNATVFLRLLAHQDKAPKLSASINAIQTGVCLPFVLFVVSAQSLRHVPGTPFAYWVSNRLRRLFVEFPRFESEGRTVRVGLQTSDDFRFVRSRWEVPPVAILDGRNGPDWRSDPNKFKAWCHERTFSGKRWVPFAKGGEYAPYYADTFLLVAWERDGEEMKAWAAPLYGNSGWSRIIKSVDSYFLPGVTWPRRTNSGFGVRAFPAGAIFADKGPVAFEKPGHEWAALGILFSLPYQRLIDMRLAAADETQSGTLSRSYEVGVIQNLPWSVPESQDDLELVSSCVKRIVDGISSRSTHDETAVYFICPSLDVGGGITSSATAALRKQEDNACKLLASAAQIEEKVVLSLNLPDLEAQEMLDAGAGGLCRKPERVLGKDFNQVYTQSIHTTIQEDLADRGGDRQIAVNSFYVSRHIEVLSRSLDVNPRTLVQTAAERGLVSLGVVKECARTVLSYCVGCVFGRWDVRCVGNQDRSDLAVNPFEPLPVCSPGMLQTADGLPAMEAPEGFPLRIVWSGVLVDDGERPDDIVRCVREVLEVVWKKRADTIEKEVCEILGFKDLRDYFRKQGKGGFWDDHVSRYSKSRRKAPIYWLLQSSKKNYALWLYCHRLDKDLLFKALVNYVEPKIRFETSRLETFRSQKGETGKEAKRLAKEVEQQEDFISELRDFEDKLRRAANLHLEPDFNDGVVLNIAPLYELVPWKEAKDYWHELLGGKYEWSSIGRQLRQKGLAK